MIGYDPTMRRSESNTKTINFGREAAVKTAELSSRAEKCFKFPTTLRKLFEVAALSKISKAL